VIRRLLVLVAAAPGTREGARVETIATGLDVRLRPGPVRVAAR
jgi:hypothetical protein